ncbi:uncharacterized protein AKAW2_80905S [Aspergillus luchuensis]|uniref:Uncharacterized protein n=2 Tax=Aspergillus kawachii TaxID=1069201 RepID=A0A146FTL1_ASPKA|nr:uncharacterized protein AKAW2_80905S [Aspergillus luchuensis]OJZ91406.1 hypothetical protein ASPFODRAFT_203839 [Aspergillus luchuensis CBS 106.47]GAA85697.1 hypothetical protein AKAW_03811 [Aspergillus luchuensis IFO 4308]BCS05104.1 hypothetical protein AKAW2_80905S [Aspergillus luchuensis]BCS16662.1 hypothetical protein ALUC_80869S [Aspergillus luchuensis]GAT28291.1 hypothetical protein RIB2604_02503690 [Aspergillus luchuensis]
MSRIIRRLISYIGKCSLNDFPNPSHATLVDTYCSDQEKRDPRIKYASIEGTEFHTSHKDKTDPKKVLTIKFLDESKRRVGTGHLHEDGTSKFRYKQKPPAESQDGGFEQT